MASSKNSLTEAPPARSARDGCWIKVCEIGICLLALLPFFKTLGSPIHGDVELYQRIAEGILKGEWPYAHREIGYPPYAIVIFTVPLLFKSIAAYKTLFAVQVLFADVVTRWLLLHIGKKMANNAAALTPAFLYAVATGSSGYFFYQRFDIFPALLTIFALHAWWNRRPMIAGLILAVAIGTKFYPVVLALPLYLSSKQRGDSRAFLMGFSAGVMPLVLTGAFLPWWMFLSGHANRGIQVESLYASILWLLKLYGLVDLNWVDAPAWREIRGNSAAAALPYAKALCALTTVASVVVLAWRTARDRTNSFPEFVTWMLLPLLPFVAFNIVLSPQYMIWLYSLASLSVLHRSSRIFVVVPFLATLTPVFYPSPEYVTGFSIFQTIILLFRNMALIAIWIWLIRKLTGHDNVSAGKSLPDPTS